MLKSIILLFFLSSVSLFTQAQQLRVTFQLKWVYARDRTDGLLSNHTWKVWVGEHSIAGQKGAGSTGNQWFVPEGGTLSMDIEGTFANISINTEGWESNSCGPWDEYNPSGCDWPLKDTDYGSMVRDINIASQLTLDEEVTFSNAIFDNEGKSHEFIYTVKYELLLPPLIVTPPEHHSGSVLYPGGNTGFCLGAEDLIYTAPTYNLSGEFRVQYTWHIQMEATLLDLPLITTDEPRLNLHDHYYPNSDSLYDSYLANSLSWRIKITVKIQEKEYVSEWITNQVVHAPKPVIVDMDVENVKCFGSNTGRVVINNIQGSGKYLYVLVGSSVLNINGWSLNSPTPEVPIIFPNDADHPTWQSGMPAGNYTLQVINFDANGNETCYTEQPVTLTEPTALSVEFEKTVYPNGDSRGFNVRCNDSSDGSVEASAFGGTPPYTYMLMPGDISPSLQLPSRFFNLKPIDNGDAILYTLSVTDAAGCSASTDPFTLKMPEPLEFGGSWFNPTICYGTPTGDIQSKTFGGTSPYKIELSGRLTAPPQNKSENELSIFTDLYAGEYTITTTDLNGCHMSVTDSVKQPEKIIIFDSLSTQPLCSGSIDGAFVVTADGGEPSRSDFYTYVLVRNTPQQNTEFTMQDTIQGGLVDTAEFQDLIAGDYTIWIADKHKEKCNVHYPFTIKSPSKVSALILSDSVQCKGDITGNITTQLTGGTPPYLAEWFDDNNKLLQANDISALEIFNLTNLPGGEYKLHIEDDHACKIDTVSRIGFPQDSLKLSIASLQLQKDSCNDITPGFVTLETSGGWRTLGNYQFSTDKRSYSSDNFFENLAPGNYNFFVKDGKGCTDSTRAEIPLGTDLQVLIDSTHMVSCYGDSNGFIRLNVFGGLEPYTISIDGGQTWRNEITYPDLPPNEYDVNVQDAGHCLYKITIPVIEPDRLNVNLLSKQLSACNQSTGSINVNVEGGTQPYALKWFKDAHELAGATDVALQNIPSGAYRLDVVDKNLCSENIEVDISDDRHPKVDTVITTPVTCYGSRDGIVEIGNITTSYSIPGYTVVYDYDTTYVYTINNQTAGQHQLFIIDTEGCKLSRKVNIASPDSLHSSFITFKHPTCYEGCDAHAEIQAHGGVGGYAYTWEPSQATTLGNSISNACAGNYEFTLTDANGCELAKNVHFKNPARITANLPEAITICPGKPLVLNAGNVGATYQWTSDTGFKSDEEQVSLSNAGNYHLLIKTPEGCIGGDTLQLIVSSTLLEADFIISSYAAIGDTVVAIEISHPEPSSIDWEVDDDVIRFGSKGAVEEFIFLEEGTYTIALQASLDGCVDRKEQVIQIQSRGTVFTGEAPSNILIENVTLHPNPNQGHFTVEVTLFKEAPVSVEFMDVSTANVLQSFTKEANDHHNLEFNVSNITQGVYILRVIAGNEIKLLRCVVY